MDERAFQDSRRMLNPSPCVFERAILADCAQCELARRRALAEREVVACSLEVARINCMTLENLFRERAMFALHLPRPGVPIAHAKVMQLQCGGLRGLQTALVAPKVNVHAMVQQAQADEASLLELPWAQIVASIVAWRPRRRATSPKA